MTTLLEPSTIRAGGKPPINTFEGDTAGENETPDTKYEQTGTEEEA